MKEGVSKLSTSKSSFSDNLTKLFEELREYWPSEYIERSILIKEETKKDMILPSDSANRLCLFLVPNEVISYYEDLVYPIVYSYGFIPITVYDVVSPGENILAKEQGLFDKSDVIIVDLSSEYYNARFLTYKIHDGVTLIPIIEENKVKNDSYKDIKIIIRPKDFYKNNEKFLDDLDKIFNELSTKYYNLIQIESLRLLDMKMYRAAFISAIIFLENSLRSMIKQEYLYKNIFIDRSSLYKMANYLIKYEVISKKQYDDIIKWNNTRNQILHYNKSITNRMATKYIKEIIAFVSFIESKYNNK